MLDSFLTFINQHTPDLKHQPTLLAVSGGIDSVVMVHLFHNLGLPAGIAHCNFGLRGEESEGDEAFVRELAARCDFPFFVTRPDVKGVAKTASVSIQMAARELRYAWFEKVRGESGYEWIATAHHANDSLETLLLNLTRGTGPAGLTGIAPVNGKLIRPLIFSNRAEVARYAAESNISWREDRTNQTDYYHRNKIRHHVIPVLTELNPSLETTFNASSERLRAANVLLEEYLQKWKAEVVRKEGEIVRIYISEILSRSEPVYRLWAILQDYGFQYGQIRGILAALRGIPGKQFFSPTYVLLVDREVLALKQLLEENREEKLIMDRIEATYQWNDVMLTLRIWSMETIPNFDTSAIAVDADLLVFPLTLRTWKQGDVFQPLGMAGKRKKVSDVLIDNKINRFEKNRVGVLLNGNGEIIWVVGVRADERFKLTASTRRIVRILLRRP